MPQREYHLQLKGYVGGYDFDRNYVDYVLDQHKDKPVHVLIDSLGGSLATALSIASAFRNHGDVTVHFVGMNASAATIASLGAKHISIDASAMYLVHKCSAEFFEWGNLNADQLATVRDNCEAAIRDLNKLDNNVASMYSAKCAKPETDLLDLMREGGWLNAQEAKAWGFVDEVTDYDDAKPVLTDAVASAMAAAGMPIPNIPTAYNRNETLIERFIAAIASLFKSGKCDGHEQTAAANPQANEEDAAPSQNENVEFTHNETNPSPSFHPSKPSALMNQSFCINSATPQQSSSKLDSAFGLHEFSLIGKVLDVEGFAVGENGVTLTLDQMQAVERALADRDKRNTELAEQVAALKANPAEKSQTVVDATVQPTPKSPIDAFADTVNSAKKLFNQVP